MIFLRLPRSACYPLGKRGPKNHRWLVYSNDCRKLWSLRLRTEVEEWLDARTVWYYKFNVESEEFSKFKPAVELAIKDPEVAMMFKLVWV
jgi:hypothetical protein